MGNALKGWLSAFNNPNKPNGKGNWLTDYAAPYRYEVNPRPMSREEKLEPQRMINDAVQDLTTEIHQVSGTSDSDIFTDGKPWE